MDYDQAKAETLKQLLPEVGEAYRDRMTAQLFEVCSVGRRLGWVMVEFRYEDLSRSSISLPTWWERTTARRMAFCSHVRGQTKGLSSQRKGEALLVRAGAPTGRSASRQASRD